MQWAHRHGIPRNFPEDTHTPGQLSQPAWSNGTLAGSACTGKGLVQSPTLQPNAVLMADAVSRHDWTRPRSAACLPVQSIQFSTATERTAHAFKHQYLGSHLSWGEPPWVWRHFWMAAFLRFTYTALTGRTGEGGCVSLFRLETELGLFFGFSFYANQLNFATAVFGSSC